jgi:hypothetical protein
MGVANGPNVRDLCQLEPLTLCFRYRLSCCPAQKSNQPQSLLIQASGAEFKERSGNSHPLKGIWDEKSDSSVNCH